MSETTAKNENAKIFRFFIRAISGICEGSSHYDMGQ